MPRLGKTYKNHCVSHDTLRNEDLVQTFTQFVNAVLPGTRVATHANALSNDFAHAQDYEHKNMCVCELFDTLGDIAPRGTVFCAHPGDGACFGFWDARNFR